MRYEKDGTYTVILPGISDIGIKGELPTLDMDSRTSGTVSSYNFSALEQKIKQKTRPLFENYKYKYTTGSDLVRGVEFDGMKVEITLNVADAYELYNVVLEVMKNDSSFVRYMSPMILYPVLSTSLRITTPKSSTSMSITTAAMSTGSRRT